jgi:hypothetical protein
MVRIIPSPGSSATLSAWRDFDQPFRLGRLGDSSGSKSFHHFAKAEYITVMTKLLDRALEAVRDLPPEVQDDIARIVLELAGRGDTAPVALSAEERTAVANSKAAAARDEFASDDEVRSVWAKHGL